MHGLAMDSRSGDLIGSPVHSVVARVAYHQVPGLR